MAELRRILRGLRRSPGFTAAAVLSLSLCIGAVATLFSLLNEVAYRRLAAPRPDRLAAVFTRDASGEEEGFSYLEFERLRAAQRSFSALFVGDDTPIRTLEVEGVTFPGTALLASDGFAETMRMRPAIGRGIADGETDTAVLGYAPWERLFGRSASALGRTIRVQGKSFRVVGVAPREFTNMAASGAMDAIVPLAGMAALARLREAHDPAWRLMGRLKDGVTLEQAREEMTALAGQLRGRSSPRVAVESAAEGTGFHYTRQRFRRPLQALLAIAGMLLLLGAINLATLLLSRGEAERRAIGIRLALGAGRARIVGLYAAEAFALTAAGTAGGILLARWAARFFSAFVWVANLDRIHDVPFGAPALLCAAAAGLAGALMFGAIPAIHALRTDPAESLRGGGRGGGAGRSTRWLVTAQIALSLALVVSAGVFGASLHRYRSVAAGYDTRQVIGISLMNRPGAYRGMDPFVYYPELHRRLAQAPGVAAVSSATWAPIRPFVAPDRKATAGGTTANVQRFLVSPNYFATLGMQLVAGREFMFHDDSRSPKVAIISQALSTRLFGNGEAVGRTIRLEDEAGGEFLIAGVAPDAAIGSPQHPNPLQVYTDYFQMSGGPRQPYLLVRTTGSPSAATIERLRREIEALGREYPLRVESMQAAADRALSQERLTASASGAYGALALVLAAVGLGGSTAYSISRRRREIAIRMAIGAQPKRVARDLLRESARTAGAGFAIGAAVAYAMWRVARARLPGLAAPDPAAIVFAASVLLLALAVAAYLPARRGARTDPATWLRSE